MSPRWTSSSKEGIGTAYNSASRLWFTLSHGIINEIYYPCIDQPNTRDLQLMITDGESFVHEERADLRHEISYPAKGALAYQLSNHDPEGRYSIHKTVISDPYLPVLLIKHRVEIHDQTLQGKLRFFTLISPALDRNGKNNTAEIIDHQGSTLLHAFREHTHLVCGSSPSFTQGSAGFVGKSDGYQDLKKHRDLTWKFDRAEDGNVAIIGEHELDPEGSFLLAVGFGNQLSSAQTPMLQSLAHDFEDSYARYIRQWSRVKTMEDADQELCRHTSDEGSIYRLSRCILQAHEDKLYQGALIASASIPWGEIRGDRELGGYHLVWPRDMLHTACALLVSGQTSLPLRSLIYLSTIQRPDGSIPQNCWLDGQPYWVGHQLDEVAAPVILAHRLAEIDGLENYDPWPMMSRALGFMLLDGPSTEQERWEENAGFSPSTIAAFMASVIAGADFAKTYNQDDFQTLLLSYCDWLHLHVKDWTSTREGTLHPDISEHFVRIVPESADFSGPAGEPAHLEIQIANGGGRHLASNIIDAGFLGLVRYGFFPADDPLFVDSLKLVDQELKHDFPQGPCWRRYNWDGYGSKIDGRPFDGAGYGGCWPIMTGERGHYELDLGNDALPYLKAMENFCNVGGMMPEQIWPLETTGSMVYGQPAGSAMPLCWSHAEYISLVHSRELGHPTDRIHSAYDRYVQNPSQIREIPEFWAPGHRIKSFPAGTQLILLLDSLEDVRWRYLGGEWRVATTRKFTHRLHVLDLGKPTGSIEFIATNQSGGTRPEKLEEATYQIKIIPPGSE